MTEEKDIPTIDQPPKPSRTEAKAATTPLPPNKRKVNNAVSHWIEKADKALENGDDSIWKEMITDSTAKKIDENGIAVRDENNRQVFRMSDDDFKVKYGFSRESARADAAERIGTDGKPLYVMKKRSGKSSTATASTDHTTKNTPVHTNKKIFSVSFAGGKEPDFDSKKPTSIQLYLGIQERLTKMYAVNWQYSHRVIINQLLDEALKEYGF